MNKKLHINTIAMLISFIINMVISLIVSPIIVEHIGGDAYAFVKMASDFTNYATIITVALNSIAARFITIEYHKGNKHSACEYFNSVLWSDLFLSAILFIVSSVIVINLENIINIEGNLVHDVKLLFAFMFLNFIISVVCTVFTVATYITNTLYLSSIVNAIASIIKVILIFAMFSIVSPKVWILGIANCLFSLIIGLSNNLFRKRLIPELSINLKYFSIKKTLVMLKSGIWSSVSSLSNTLSDGLDLLITNLFINGVIMGQLSLAKTISSLISSLLSTLASLFSPELTMYYAKNEIDKVVKELKIAMKFTGFVSSIFFCVFLMNGKDFFRLWVPSQDSQKVFNLAVLCIVSVLASGIISPLNGIFVLTNHLRLNSIVWLCISSFDILLVYILLLNTTLEGYAVAGVSSIVGMIVNLSYMPLITCHYLKIRKTEFYRLIGQYFITVLIGMAELLLINMILNFDKITWITWFIRAFIMSIIMVINNYCILLNKEEKALLLKKIKRQR